jgi:predicted dehydrogenase
MSAKYGIQGFINCDAMLDQVQPDIAVVMTPVSTHRTIVTRLASAGVHILCEKPLATNLDDAVAMVRSCEAYKVHLLYGSSYRYLPAVIRARELIKQGQIGFIRCITEQIIGGKGLAKFQPMSPIHYPDGEPGGGELGLVDHGIHFMDIIPWLADSPIRRVVGRGNKTGQAAIPEFAALELESGVLGFLLYDEGTHTSDLPWEGVFSAVQSWIPDHGFSGHTGEWQPAAHSIRIHGTTGSIRLLHYANKLYLTNAKAQVEIKIDGLGAPDHFGAQLEGFLATLRASCKAAVSGWVGVDALNALLAIYESEKNGTWTAPADYG